MIRCFWVRRPAGTAAPRPGGAASSVRPSAAGTAASTAARVVRPAARGALTLVCVAAGLPAIVMAPPPDPQRFVAGPPLSAVVAGPPLDLPFLPGPPIALAGLLPGSDTGGPTGGGGPGGGPTLGDPGGGPGGEVHVPEPASLPLFAGATALLFAAAAGRRQDRSALRHTAGRG